MFYERVHVIHSTCITCIMKTNLHLHNTIQPNDATWRQKWCQRAWVMLKSAYNTQRPFLKDCLWGFFSVNVTLLQTSLWKCHPATLFISSPALFSIIHHFPLEGSHTRGEALFELHVLKCDCETEETAVQAVITCYWRFSHDALLQRSGGPSITSAEEEESCSCSVFASFKFWRLRLALVDVNGLWISAWKHEIKIPILLSSLLENIFGSGTVKGCCQSLPTHKILKYKTEYSE